MKTMSRRVKLSQGKLVLFDIESYFIKPFRMLGDIIHPTEPSDIVLKKGLYSLELGDFREFEFEEED